MKYVTRHPKAGTLFYRRAFPAQLRRYIPRSPREFKRSLRTTTFAGEEVLGRYQTATAEYERLVNEAQAKATGNLRPLTSSDIPHLVENYAFQTLKMIEDTHFDPREEAFCLPSISSMRYAPIAFPFLDDKGRDIIIPRRERVLKYLPMALEAWQEALGSGDREEIIQIEGPTAEDLLHDAQLAADRNEQVFFDLCYQLLCKDHKIYESVMARYQGQIVPTPTPPAIPISALQAANALPVAKGSLLPSEASSTMRQIA